MSYSVIHKPIWEIAYHSETKRIALAVYDQAPDEGVGPEPLLKALLPRHDAYEIATRLLNEISLLDHDSPPV